MAVPCCDKTVGDLAVDVARAWIGTPYVHQASARQVGTDCLGLVRGVWRAVLGPEPQVLSAYSPSWSEPKEDEELLRGLEQHLIDVEAAATRAGDVLAFRMLERGPVKHLAILSSGSAAQADASIIHAYSGLAVCETRLTRSWQRRIAAAFRFPPMR